MQDDDLDELFYGADNVNPVDRELPTPTPPPAQPRKIQRPSVVVGHMTEKDKWTEASRVAKRQRSQGDGDVPTTTTTTPTPTSTKKKTKPDDAFIEAHLFPHSDDLRRLENYIYMCTLSIVTTGKMGGTLDHSKCNTVTDIDDIVIDVNALFRRFRKLRRALHAGMVSVIERTGNPVLLGIVRCMDNSKLTVYSKPKYLHPTEEGEEHGGGGTAYDVWTLQKIPTEANVRGAALTPVSGTMSQPKPPPPEFMQRGPIMFHVDSEYVNVLKCLYTLLFFLDFLNSEIDAKIESVLKTMPPELSGMNWNADIHHAWDTLFARDSESKALVTASASSSSSRKNGVSNKDVAKLYPMYVFVESMQKQLLTCCSAMQKIVGKDPFFIQEPSRAAAAAETEN